MLDEKMKTLKEKMEALSNHENEVNGQLRNAIHDFRKKPTATVEIWLQEVKRQKTEVDAVKQRAGKRRYRGRSKFLSLVHNNIQEVNKLIEQKARFPEELLIEVPDQRGVKMLTMPLGGQATIDKNLETIKKWLIDEYTEAIGIHGMGGVGKTAIVTLVYNWLLENPTSADHVYWVTVTAESSIHKLQNDIAKCTKLDLSKEDDTRKRAADLYKTLERRKKFVLIFDGMWNVFSPTDIGIPVGGNKGKLIVTSRSLTVCRGMNCQQSVKVEPLVEDEAWNLFRQNVWTGNMVLDQSVEEIARSVAMECAGLPLAIITTARSMKGVEDISGWRNALDELREPVEGLSDMEEEVYKRLKFSYDRLKDEKLQRCFLYCASFPEDYKIPKVDLIIYWIAEGLLDGRQTRRAKFDRGRAILKKLEDVCLLESVKEDDGFIGVKMHDVIRDMALNITKKENRLTVLTVKSAQLLPMPNESDWSGNLERVCLHGNIIQNYLSLSISTSFPRLVTNLLQHNYRITTIPDPFFVHMQSLRVLDLSYMTNLNCLPNSISNLKSLRGLLLNYCINLTYLPPLEKLKELRELFLQGSGVKKVPEGLERLVNLKCLDLSKTSIYISTGFLPNLSHLQCLRLDSVKDGLPTEEFGSLTQLEMLGVRFSNLHQFDSYVNTDHWQTLSHYRLQIKDECDDGSLRCRQVSIRRYKHGQGKEQDQGIVLPTNMQELSLVHCFLPKSLLDFSPSLKNNDCSELQRCLIRSSNGIEHLWSTTKITSSPQNIQILMLVYLPDLTSLFKYERVEMESGPSKPPPQSGTFSRLKLLSVAQCHKLKYLFTAWLVSNYMENLQMIYVFDCSAIEHIIIEEEEEEEEEITIEGNSILTFGQLQTLKLEVVPQLKSICKGTKTMVCPSLQNVIVYDCPNLKRLSLSTMHVDDNRRASDTHPYPFLKISGLKEWWDLLIWDPREESIFRHSFSLLKEPHHANIEGIWLKDLTCYEEVK
ncbi:hypothetical protein F0562_030644 [Nyssa sinensis]|uniref:Uncharacterized protein n=1 Tax=Nyssa sinensis TaxID=561372 RepID=A0A5J5B3A9_9ASTE|nr:hypothetical protein F0562_030644 [Nyssa sinensis]